MSKDKLLVSIVVPVYNAGSFLKKCIESIIGQSYMNLEIILVDDGSTDGSGVVCDDYAKNDARIKVLHKENGGLVSARKTGVVAAKGDYVMNVDADDWLEMDYVKNFVDALGNEKYDCIWTMSFFAEYETQTEVISTEIHDQETCYKYAFALNEDNPTTMFQAMWLKMIKLELCRDIQLSVDNRIAHMEDISFTTRLADKEPSVLYVDNCGYHYRRYDGSMVSANRGVSNQSDDMFLLDTMNYLRESENGLLKKNTLIAYARAKVLHEFSKMQEETDTLFPFKNVNPNEKVIVYCAGPVGRHVIDNVKEREFADIVAWVDKNRTGQMYNGMLIEKPETILEKEFDKIVIATTHVGAIVAVKKTIMEFGIPEKKISELDFEQMIEYSDKSYLRLKNQETKEENE